MNPSAETPRERAALDKTYRISLVIKAVDGLIETIGGVLLLVVSPNTWNQWAGALFAHELSQDPNDFLARHVLRITANLHATQTFGAVYLISHGAAKLVVVGGLWRRQAWAYPVGLAFLTAFVAYQLYRMTFDFSVGLLLLTVFDVFVIWLVWRDYQEHRHVETTL